MKKIWSGIIDFLVLIGILIAVLLFVLVMIALPAVCALYSQNTSRDEIIYDRQWDMIISDLDFISWFSDLIKKKDAREYCFIREQNEIVGISGNVSFKAKLVMPRTREAVKKFALRQFKGTADEDLFKDLQDCVASVTKIPNKVEGYPDISARAWSVFNMNFHCPLAQEYGYQWAGNLEIAQCMGSVIKDVRDKGLCVELVRGR